jgi:hypothetical protein
MYLFIYVYKIKICNIYLGMLKMNDGISSLKKGICKLKLWMLPKNPSPKLIFSKGSPCFRCSAGHKSSKHDEGSQVLYLHDEKQRSGGNEQEKYR